MGIDRDDYEPITGNPRRDTASSNDDPETSSGGEGTDGTSDSPGRGPNGGPSGRDGGPSDPNGDPSDPGGAESTPDGAQAGPHSSPKSSSSGEPPRTSSGRKRRVKVTPQDWSALKRLSERLGVGYAKVYRIAFTRLLQNSDM